MSRATTRVGEGLPTRGPTRLPENRVAHIGAHSSVSMVVHEALTATFGPFLIPVVLFVFGGVVYVTLWWLGKAGVGDETGQQR